MADRSISELTPVTGVNAEDSFVLQQNNRAMRLTGQVLLNWLAVALDGHGGINNIAKTGTSVLVDTYTITFADETTTTFTVTNGKSISSIAKTDTTGLVDTYTVTFNDGSTTTFTVTNGKGISSVSKTGTASLVDTYTIAYNDGTSTTFTVTNGKGISSVEKTDTTGLVDTYTITYNDGTSTTFTVTNGRGITGLEKIGTSGLEDTYRISYNDGTHYDFVVTNGEKGDKGDNTYTFIMYSTNSPTRDSDIHSTPDNWIGVYYGPSDTAPTSYQAYQWFQIKGEKGDQGDSISIVGTAVDYAVGEDGTTVPTSGWQSTIPIVPQGYYLWTRTVVTYTDGTTQTSTTTYASSRNGIDGSGSVNSVNNISPDANHNVTLPMDNAPTLNSGNFVKSGGVALVESRHEESLANQYSPNTPYAVGDYCIYENSLYRCTMAIPMGEAWDATHWESAVISTDMNDTHAQIQNQIGDLQEGLAIIVDGDTASMAVPSGGYAYIRNNTHGLAEGLYKNLSNSAFPTTGGTASSSVFSAISNGGMNEMKSITDTLNGKMSTCLVGETLNVSGTTDAGGRITVSKTKRFSGNPAVISNISHDLGTPYSVTIESIATTTVTLRIRSIVDNSAIANTSVSFPVLLFGVEA